MSQQAFLNQVSSWDTLHVSGEFASNGVVAVRVNNIDPASTKLAQLVYRYSDPAKLPAAHIIARLPSINDLPPALVFAPANWDWLKQDITGLHLIAAELYEIITGKFNVDGDYWSYRCLWDESSGDPVSVVMVYDVDLDLVGFCCGLRVGDRDREAVKAALLAALALETQEAPNA